MKNASKVTIPSVEIDACSLFIFPRPHHHQRLLLPQQKHLLVRPVLRSRAERKVKVSEHFGQNEARLQVCKDYHLWISNLSSISRACLIFVYLIVRLGTVHRCVWGLAYFFPIQFRGPVENGCRAVLSSDRNSGLLLLFVSQRSGMNLCACLKLRGFWYVGHWWTEIVVCCC